MADIEKLKERVARACRVLGRLDLTKAAQGHVSTRIPGETRMLIRARGPGELGVRYTSADQIIEVDFDGKMVKPNSEGLAVPIEVFIHTEVYKARPDIFSVIHIHPPAPVMFTICHKPLLPIIGAYDPSAVRMCMEGIPTYERSILINTPARGQEIVHTMKDRKVCLMRGHGITTAAPSIEQAALHCITLNELATMNERAAHLGTPQPISSEDQAEFAALKLGSNPANGDEPTGGDAASWRYYVTFTEA